MESVRKFLVRNSVGDMVGSFYLEFLGKKEGLEYRHVYGSYCWQDVVGAMTILAKRISITKIQYENQKALYNGEYEMVQDSYVEIRYSPVIVNKATQEREKLPFTIEGDEFLEHSWKMPYETAVKVLLAISMKCNGRTFTLDRQKLAKLNHSRRANRKSTVEVRI